ncbi:hypothetical protein [Burkholderia pyrrocinia]|uniref:hypothetical protein n=1 Tax=Burkholderia pyrrocinia TaxID=60550 RepID=UPI001F2E6B7D|nr:hypothetical protein [Burkholderia pyrrocinia]
MNEIAQSIKDAGPTGNKNVDELLGNLASNVLAGGAGAVVGGGTGALAGASVDRFNRQLHPDERASIERRKESYAKQNGLTVAQAEQELLMQANMMVQNGSPGQWNERAAKFLREDRGLLLADGGSGTGYMFYTTPEQRANVEMYAKYYPNGVGMNIPNGQAIANSAGRDKGIQGTYEKLTLGAAAGAVGIAVGAPIAALSGTPIFSTGGLLGSGSLASPVGTGAISAGINAGAQYRKDGEVNPVDVAGAFATGVAGSYGKLGWNVFVNTIGGATTTALNNILQGKNDSVVGAGITSGLFSSLGYGAGKISGDAINSAMKPTISNSTNWAGSGVWSGSGYNIFVPNNAAAIGATFSGGTMQEGVQNMFNHMLDRRGGK